MVTIVWVVINVAPMVVRSGEEEFETRLGASEELDERIAGEVSKVEAGDGNDVLVVVGVSRLEPEAVDNVGEEAVVWEVPVIG